jgi:ABC-type branched-subunit amino acid transport system substrate-binding protein
MKQNSLYCFQQPVVIFFTLLCTVLLTIPGTLKGQSFEEGLAHYESGEFTQAAALFDQIHTNKGLLFAGKSYWGNKDLATARSRLLKVNAVNGKQLSTEANYTLSLIDIQQKKYDQALHKLFQLARQEVMPRIATESQDLYDGLLNYLTFDQRLKIMQNSQQDTLLYDLASTALGRVDYNQAQILVTKIENSVDNIDSGQISKLSAKIEDQSAYQQLQKREQLEPFEGLTHSIGIALPSYDPQKNEYSVSRGLYLGFTLAAEQFNEQHEVTIDFVYENTGTEADSSQQALEALKSRGVDATLGPLFSEKAKTMSNISSQYEIPIIAPLANSSSITKKGGYFYQINPPLKVHGKNMARYAMESLNIDSVAIIAERGSLGEASAKAFRNEFEKRGGGISHFFVEDLGTRGQGLSKYARFFSGSQNSSSVSALYAPFTGDSAPALIRRLLRQLNTLESNITILGSPEWASRSSSSNKIGERPVYFTESFYTQPNSKTIDQFKLDFRNRFNTEANRFAMIGYDTATFVLKALEEAVNPERLQKKMVSQPPYNGLITNIEFRGDNVNQKLMIFKITDRDTYLVNE